MPWKPQELGAAPSPLCGFDTATREATFVCGLEGSTPNMPKPSKPWCSGTATGRGRWRTARAVDAALHQLELSEREITGDGFPYGLHLLMEALTRPGIHGADPLPALDSNPLLEQLRVESRNQNSPRLVRQLLLDNPHQVRLT
ncbi:MAG: hypothetical protein R3F36_00905 [Candidatus Competibacteraceae bacterium]